MAYVKPGVEIKQEQVTVSPTLIAPDLITTLIGKTFFVADIDDYSYSEIYEDTEVSVDYAGTPTGAAVHTDSVYVDLIVASGTEMGSVIHLDPASDFTPDATSVTISAGLSTTYSGMGLGDGDTIKIGYRALRNDLDPIFEIESVEMAEEKLINLSSMNPMGLAMLRALDNAGSSVLCSPAYESTTLDPTTNNFTSADIQLNAISSRELYAMVPLTTDTTAIDALEAHAVDYSSAINKKERMVIAAPLIPWTGNVGEDTSDTAEAIKQRALLKQERRLVYVFPDVTYTSELRHVSTLTSSYLNNVQGVTDQPTYLAQDYTITVSGVDYKYRIGDTLTSTMLSNFASVQSYVRVYVAVPGYILAAGIGGQVGGGLSPDAPHTNVPVGGFSRLHYSTDTFSETNFNTMAEGGNYLMVQNSVFGPVYSRHQLTTDMTSVERRELSILKSLDFVAKFIRTGTSPYIGRYNITPQFMKLLNMVLQAQALYLVREGYVNDLKILKVEQDATQMDTILVVLSVAVKYPVNYIKITLQF